MLPLPPQTPINAKADAYAAVALELSRSAARTLRSALDIAYGPDPMQRLDIYLPQATASRAPVMLYLHGGGWTHGYKEWCGFNALPLVETPAIVVSAGYRLAPAHRLPAAIDDAADAVAWLWRHIALFGGDPERLFLAGHSAGGHLATMVGLQPALLAARGVPAAALRGCFPVSCSYDLDYADPAPGSGEEKTLREVLATPADAAAMSPLSYVAGNKVPFFLSWGGEDLARVQRTGSAFHQALRAQPGTVRQHVFPTFDHFTIHLDQIRTDSLWVATVRDWMAPH